ncbi:MAG: dTDP-4-dehydrorhamnose reductase [Anaerolineaceae bacterium]|nr:dTDP-4-dehydrorhamnose reductase [Anaerolineaceae bacterium]
MLRILLFGKNGQLGWELQRTLASLGLVFAFDFPEIDFTQAESLRKLIEQTHPDLIVNPAAYTAVDTAESDVETAYKVNQHAVSVLAEEAYQLNIPLIHFSTDFVFDGTKGSSYDELDSPNPLNVYGKSKLKGEEAVWASGCLGIVLRTSWVYSMRAGGFVTKVLGWAREQETLRIVDDQFGEPTSARMLAEATALMVAQSRGKFLEFFSGRAGLYHLAGAGACSRFEWAEKILELDPHKDEQQVNQILPVKTDAFPSPAVRPVNSTLDCNKFEQVFGLRLPDWQLALKMMLEKD